jgi:4-hydroxy-4-methyl-2-oxoglutarate aldolase
MFHPIPVPTNLKHTMNSTPVPSSKNNGLLPPSSVHHLAGRVSREVIGRFLALEDLSGTISDVLDKLGIRGTVGSSILIPTLPAARIVGTAVTVRNIPQDVDPFQSATVGRNRMAEVEGIHQAEPGDVLVIQGLQDVSNMGGIMATLAKRQKISGAVVDGGIRDVGQSRRIDFPVWSRDMSPITGKWRCETVEVNGPVNIAGVSVHPGDLVIADETGTCFVPAALIAKVLEMAENITKQEAAILDEIGGGIALPELVRKLYAQD